MNLDGAFLRCVTVCSVVRVNALSMHYVAVNTEALYFDTIYVFSYILEEWVGVFHHNVQRFMV